MTDKQFIGSVLDRTFPDGNLSITIGLQQKDIEILQAGLQKVINSKGPDAFVNVTINKSKNTGKRYAEMGAWQFENSTPKPKQNEPSQDLPF